jgi:hypothetical protein
VTESIEITYYNHETVQLYINHVPCPMSAATSCGLHFSYEFCIYREIRQLSGTVNKVHEHNICKYIRGPTGHLSCLLWVWARPMVMIGCISYHKLQCVVVWYLGHTGCPTFFRYVRCHMLLGDISCLVIQHDL